MSALALVGAVGVVVTVTVSGRHVALMQPVEVFRARAKYVVVLVGETEMERPEPAGAPPQEPTNQSMVSPGPAEPVSGGSRRRNRRWRPSAPTLGWAGSWFTVTVIEACRGVAAGVGPVGEVGGGRG